MQNGKSKVISSIICLIFLYSCNRSSPEDYYNSLVSIEGHENYQELFRKRLDDLNINIGESIELSMKELVGISFKELILIDLMVMDFSKSCEKIPILTVLEDKEFCQIALIFHDGIDIIRGRCDYNLLNVGRSFDILAFELNYSIEKLNSNDLVIVSLERNIYGNDELYVIEPKVHEKYKAECDKLPNL